ncbi:MAG: NADPH-dependent assimilatory sulfite reductase hemoprotein subunit [Gemmataceae bacterium]|nr:NADPH-dependent assimilatory sulfite reductase hemoprotein subunit [Gemmataceae bacterium]
MATEPVEEQEKSATGKSAVEGIKEKSQWLRGTISLEMAKDSDHFSDEDKQLLKFHGSYQQEDRDARKNRRAEGLGKYYMFMVRARIPAGKMTAAQYLAFDSLAGTHANGTIRLTSRQSIQFHGIIKKDLKGVIAGINDCLLSTLAACGDVNRNVMACPAPLHQDKAHKQIQDDAHALAMHLAPKTTAYHEIWLNGKAQHAPVEDAEPLYGKVYLPRKFKTGFTLPNDNCIDIYSQDLGFLADVKDGEVTGYNVLVGGGMGMTHGKPATFPHLGKAIFYIPRDEALHAAEAVVKLYRDHGYRADRKRARIKYLVADWGLEKFRSVVQGYLSTPMALPKEISVSGFDTHLGWHSQGEGKFFYGISIENGRIKDEGDFKLRQALRQIVSKFQTQVRITAIQDLVICDLNPGADQEIEKILRSHGVRPPGELSNIQKNSLACPAIPTCGLALSESERLLPALIDELEKTVAELGLSQEIINVRMTGCPNGCVRPYQSEIGLVGRSGEKYVVYVGGHVHGARLNFLLKDLVPKAQIIPMLRSLLVDFKAKRLSAEGFGDYCHRVGKEYLLALLPAGA